MILLAFTVLLMAQGTWGKIECHKDPFDICENPELFNKIPREVTDLKDRCVEMLSYLRCTKDYQDECRRIKFYPEPDLFEATYSTVSDICKEGTLLNTVAVENLKCLNDTFGRTRCRAEAQELVYPLQNRLRDEDYENTLSLHTIICLEEARLDVCILSAISENCGEIAAESMLEVMRRTKTLKYVCSSEQAKSILDKLDTLDLNADQKNSLTLLLERVAE